MCRSRRAVSAESYARVLALGADYEGFWRGELAGHKMGWMAGQPGAWALGLTGIVVAGPSRPCRCRRVTGKGSESRRPHREPAADDFCGEAQHAWIQGDG
jgi:hypothetical protein